MKKQFVISKRCYEYNDETYDSTEGGIPVFIADSEQEAKSWMRDQLINDARNSIVVSIIGFYLEGNQLDDYIQKFGDESLEFYKSGGYSYAYIDCVPNFKNMSDDKIIDFFDYLSLEPYFLTII